MSEFDTTVGVPNPSAEPAIMDHAGLEVLTPGECDRLLRRAEVARIGFVDSGEPVILPINIGMWHQSIVFSTQRGSKLAAALMNCPVCIEIDDWDTHTQSGWSVLAKGVASTITDGREIDALDRRAVRSWVRPHVPKQWVLVRLDEITGRRTVETAP